MTRLRRSGYAVSDMLRLTVRDGLRGEAGRGGRTGKEKPPDTAGGRVRTVSRPATTIRATGR